MEKISRNDQQHLIELNQWLISGLDIVADLSKSFQSNLDQSDNLENIYQLTQNAINKLIELKCVAFLHMDDDNINLSLNSCHPLNQKGFFNKVFEEYSDNGTIGWALCENRLIVVPDKSRSCTLLFHVLSTAKTVYGLFIATTNLDAYVTDATQKLISVLLLNTAHAIEGQQFTREMIANERLKLEVDSAAQIQRQLLPAEIINSPSCLIYGFCEPSAQVGGDYYDYICLGQDYVYFSLCDVAGHGVAAGLFMTMIKSIFRTLIREKQKPDEITNHLNNFLRDEIPDPQIYVTGIFGELDLKTKTLSYAVAGHPPPLLISAKSKLKPLAGRGIAMGLVGEFQYELNTVQLHSGDSVILFTDGLYELRNPDNEMLDETVFQSWLEKIDWTLPEKSVSQLKLQIESFTNTQQQSDDQTMLVLHVK